MSQQREQLLRYLVTTIWNQYDKPGFSMVIDSVDRADPVNLGFSGAIKPRTIGPPVRISIDAERLLVPAPCECCGSDMLVRLVCHGCESSLVGKEPEADRPSSTLAAAGTAPAPSLFSIVDRLRGTPDHPAYYGDIADDLEAIIGDDE